MRVMGLDYGRISVGVAISDSAGIVASPVETIIRKGENKLRQTYARLRELIAEYGVEHIVVGLPIHMNGEMSERAERSKEFAAELEQKTGIGVSLMDERLTTAEASSVLKAGGVRREDEKKYVDKLAASLILQRYLDSQSA